MAAILKYNLPVVYGGITYTYPQTIYVNADLYNYIREHSGTLKENLSVNGLKTALFDPMGLFFKKFYFRPGNLSEDSANESHFSNYAYPPFFNQGATDSTNTFAYSNGSYSSGVCSVANGGGITPLYTSTAPSTTNHQIVFYVVDTSVPADMMDNYISYVTIKYYYNTGLYSVSFGSSSNKYRVAASSEVLTWFNADPDPSGEVTEDPYEPGGYSEPTTYPSNFSEYSDSVDLDELPSEEAYGAQACGLVTIFSPTKLQLKKLADVLWSRDFFSFLQNAVENIADLFISLSTFPFTIPKGNTVEVTWFDYVVTGQQVGTNIYLDLAEKQWLEFNMGSIDLSANNPNVFASGSVLDYSPYSKLGIFLPFIGYQELDIDECRDTVMSLIYRIDLLSGTCLAAIKLSDATGSRTIYQFTGNCAIQIPLTSMDAQGMFTNAVTIATSLASAGATAAVASAGDAFTQERLSAGKLSQSGADMQNAQHAAMVSNAEGSLASSTANGVMGMKPNFKKSGAVSGAASLFGVMQPYLYLTTPRQSYPEDYMHYKGFPSNITETLGNLQGYTVVEDIRLNGLVATSTEVEEIYNLLKTGVII